MLTGPALTVAEYSGFKLVRSVELDDDCRKAIYTVYPPCEGQPFEVSHATLSAYVPYPKEYLHNILLEIVEGGLDGE